MQAGTDQLLARGVEIGLGQIRLREAIDASGVARATAYRALGGSEREPQEELRRQVLLRVLERDTRRANHEDVKRVVSAELAARADQLASEDVAERTRAVRALIRVGCGTSFAATVASRDRSILIAAYGATLSQGSDDVAWQRDALARGELTLATLLSEFYGEMSVEIGYRLRAGFDMPFFATMVAALLEGLAMRTGVSSHVQDRSPGVLVDPEDHCWTAFALGFEALFVRFFEPIDPENPFADLSRY